MKNLITESKYKMMTSFNENSRGCYLIDDKKHREWCVTANSMLSKDGQSNPYVLKVKKEINDFKPFISDKYEKKLKKYIKEFDEKDPFFRENLQNVNILKEDLKYCGKASSSIDYFINSNIKPNFLFVYQDTTEMVYDIINKFNTNYTAISYLLTKTLQLKNKDVDSLNFETAFNQYFIDKVDGQSEFYVDLMSYLDREGLDVNKKFDGVVHTIIKTSEQGLSTEHDFEKFLRTKNVDYKIFAGNFSFNDLMGVDLMIKDNNGLWVPVQVKSNMDHCKNNKRFCQNLCVAPNRTGDSKWIRYYYKDGKTIVKEF